MGRRRAPSSGGLTIGKQEVSDGHDFWPAVSDILMVVLILFMLGMVILVTNNQGLTEHSEDLETEKAALVAEISKLNRQLAGANHRLELVQTDLIGTESDLREAKLEAAALKEHLKDSRKALDQKYAVIANLGKELEASKRRNATLEKRDLDHMAALAAVNQELEIERLENLKLSDKLDESSSETESWKDNFERIKVRYDKLIKPARSRKGKRIAEIHYLNASNKVSYRLKEPGKRSLIKLNRTQLYRRLAQLQKVNPKDLYIKIVFPEGSQVTHDEAWRVTKGLLSRFDYYYHK